MRDLRHLMLFEVLAGDVLYHYPWDDEGRKLEADGKRYLTLEQAAKATPHPEDVLAERWLRQYERMIPKMPEGEAEEPGPDVIRTSLANVRLASLHQLRWPELDNEQFWYLINFCRQHNLSPWGSDVFPTKRHDPIANKEKFEVQVGLDGLRKIAARTGKYVGFKQTMFCDHAGNWVDVWLKPNKHPAAAMATVLRTDGLSPVAIVRWDSAAQHTTINGRKRLEDRWAEKPDRMLEKCAKAAALRDAFPDQLAGLYLPEEMIEANARKPEEPAAEAETEPEPRREEEEMPQTHRQFELKLLDLGLKSPQERKAAIDRLRGELQGLLEVDAIEFYRRAIEAIRNNPVRYGVNPVNTL